MILQEAIKKTGLASRSDGVYGDKFGAWTFDSGQIVQVPVGDHTDWEPVDVKSQVCQEEILILMQNVLDKIINSAGKL